MPSLTINIPDELFEELKDAAKELTLEPDELLTMSFNHFIQTPTIDNVAEGLERSQTPDENLISFPELKEELDMDINFHPLAMEELESLDEEDQIELIGELINRISQEDNVENIDLVLKDDEDGTLLLSSFDFGDLIYRLTDEVITIYHIALNEELDEDFDDEDEDFDEEIEELGDEIGFGEEEQEY